jgi:ABC-type Fe3+/spermidine/putrescine transport system ATPase subunit/ABC-type nitrate/sulfonate/bicarbonate transport system permease component
MKRVAVLWFISAGLVLITLFGTGSAVPLGAVGALEAATGAPVFGGFVWLLCAVSIGIGALTLGVLRAARRSAADISPENETSARRLRLLGQKLQYYCGVLVLAQLILFLWLLFTRTIPILPHDLLPSPVQVAAGLYAERVGFLNGACWTTGRLLIAFLLAILAGLPLGIVCGRSKQAPYLTPYSSILAVLPPIVLAPFFLFLYSRTSVASVLGQDFADRVPDILYDETFRIAATGFTAFWSVFSAALRASAKTPVELLQAAEGLGAGWYRRLRDVVLPLSLPSVFFGAKSGLTIGFIVLLYVEGIGASDRSRGLGGFIAQFYDSNNMSRMYAMIAVVAFITLVLHKCLDALDAFFTPWERASEEPSLFSILLMKQRDKLAEQVSHVPNDCPLSERVSETFDYLLSHRRKFPEKQITIQFSDLKVDYIGRSVISIDTPKTVESGTVVALIGESGNGKTTLSRVIAGFVTPGAGSLTVSGKEVLRDGKRKFSTITQGVAYMFQDDALFPHLTVQKNLELVFRYRKSHPPDESGQIDNVIRMLRLEKKIRSYPSKLSGGEQQRLALARALLMDVPVLIIDEGLSSIDQPSKSLLRNVIRSLTKSLNLTTLYISHDREDVLQIADRIWYLKNGKIIADGQPHELYYNANEEDTARFLGHTNLFHGSMSGDTLLLRSYLGRPNVLMSPFTVQVPHDKSNSPEPRPVDVYIPKNSIEIETEPAAEHMRFLKTVGEDAFSGSEWELRIATVNGAEFDVVLPEEEYQRFRKCRDCNQEMSVVLRDARILAAK